MRSKARLGSHPLHPILVTLPVAGVLGAFVFDTVGALFSVPSALTVGWWLNLLAPIMGLIAAVPGVIDFVAVIPPGSSAKSRAALHGALNTLWIVLSALAFTRRVEPGAIPSTETLLLEGIALLIAGIAAWLGGVLVYRHQIGVDHRHAANGAWREREIYPGRGGRCVVTPVETLEVNQMMLLRVVPGGARLVLARTEQGYTAFDDRCSHQGGSLADGIVAGETVTCPWHGSQFHVFSGNVLSGPAVRPIHVYETREEHGAVVVYLEHRVAPPVTPEHPPTTMH